ncbi:MAG: helix-turn-helix domain-containing protein [Phycisphaerales bacterium]|nr:MAG: helix-turn-helix domain-containing protein [Phycisphaerales bacterium]
MFEQRANAKPKPLLVDVREAARLLSVCERTVFNMVERGELTPVRIGRAVRFAVDDLGAWVTSRTGKNCANSENYAGHNETH